ncbi:TetR/AcrR family transcriptional regulator, partial [Citrobacter freundii]|uniref:TetR/AcrR family transcriptional regulator n=2 Tax=Gammaproteobacteria TaxID=1236 RepID=UPI0021C56C47
MRLKTSLKKRLVIEHALALYNLHGIEATTVEMVCDEAKISVGSFYHHFGSKEGLALAVYTVGLKDFSLYLSEALQKCKTIHQVVTVIVNANIDWIYQNRIWAKFIFEQRHI